MDINDIVVGEEYLYGSLDKWRARIIAKGAVRVFVVTENGVETSAHPDDLSPLPKPEPPRVHEVVEVLFGGSGFWVDAVVVRAGNKDARIHPATLHMTLSPGLEGVAWRRKEVK